MNTKNKTRRDFLKSASIGVAAATLSPFLYGGGKQDYKRRPNVILIYTDDQNYEQIGCYGGDVYTPHMDGMAKEGVRFTRAYVPTAICTPSRYSVTTGQYPGRCSHSRFKNKYPDGVQIEVSFNTPVNPDGLTLAKVMKNSGYKTGVVGKWDLGYPTAEEYGKEFLEPFPRTNAWIHVTGEADPKDPKISTLLKRNHERLCQYAKSLGFEYADALYRLNPEMWNHPLNIHNMEWVTDAALRFIDKNVDQPFFLYMAPTLHHIPHPQESLAQADPRITMAGYLDKAPNVQPPRDGIIPRVQKAGYKPETAYCTWLDDAVGAVIKRLQEYGLYDDTVVILMSDHQTHDKGSLYEGGVRTPCIMQYPKGIPPGKICASLMQNIDLIPTILDLCQIEVPSDMQLDGSSMLPILHGDVDAVHKVLYFEYGWTRALCTERWKYLALRYSKAAEELKEKKGGRLYHDRVLEPHQHNVLLHHPNYWDPDQLYDLSIDSEETTNLAYDPKYSDILNKMKGQMKEILKTFGDHPFGEFVE